MPRPDPPPAQSVSLRRVVVGVLDTNCWVVHRHGGTAALVVDPGDDTTAIMEATAGLDIKAIVLTHAHFDHVLAAGEVSRASGAPVLAHPDEEPVWPAELDHLERHGHWDAGTATAELLVSSAPRMRPPPGGPLWDGTFAPLREGDQIDLDGLVVTAWHTPGHTPGGLSLVLPGHVLTGDTLFPGGPGLTGDQWPLSDRSAILASVDRLLGLPAATRIHPGHGADTTVGRERSQPAGMQ